MGRREAVKVRGCDCGSDVGLSQCESPRRLTRRDQPKRCCAGVELAPAERVSCQKVQRFAGRIRARDGVTDGVTHGAAPVHSVR